MFVNTTQTIELLIRCKCGGKARALGDSPTITTFMKHLDIFGRQTYSHKSLTCIHIALSHTEPYDHIKAL